MRKKYYPPRPETIKTKMQKRTLGLEKAKEIISFCNDYYGFDVTTDSRKRYIIDARFMTIKMIYDYTGLILKDIGCLFNRKHDTMIHSLSTIGSLIDYDKEIREHHQYLKSKLCHIKNEMIL